MGSSQQKGGSDAERLVAALLEARGIRVVSHRYRSGPDEIDLIIEESGRTAAVEVKSTTQREVEPLDAVDATKLQRLRRGMAGYGRPISRMDLAGLRATEWGIELRWLIGIGQSG